MSDEEDDYSEDEDEYGDEDGEADNMYDVVQKEIEQRRKEKEKLEHSSEDDVINNVLRKWKKNKSIHKFVDVFKNLHAEINQNMQGGDRRKRTAESMVAFEQPVEVTEENVNQMLRNLRNSNTIPQVMDVFKSLHAQINQNASLHRRKETANTIVELEGVGAIYSALKDWHGQSEEFSMSAIRSLVNLTYLVEKAKTTLVRLGGIKTTLNVAKKYSENYIVRSNAVGLLRNISKTDDNEMKEEVAVDACTDFCAETMKDWPDDAYIQDAGCHYFINISTVTNVKANLRRRGICTVLAIAIKFLDSDDERERAACNAAQVAFDNYRQK